MKTLLPAGAMGLLVASMMAAAMSTVSDNLNFGSQVLVSDIYRRWFVRTASEKHYLHMGKVGLVVIISMAIVVVFNVRIITDVAIFMLQLSAAELPANWAQWWWWRFNGKARIAASFGGAAIFCVVVLGPKLLIALGVPSAAKLVMPWWWQTFLVMGLTTVFWVTVALLTKPDSDEVLDKFYQRVRPLGCWGPVRQRAQSNQMEATPRRILPNQDWKLIARGFLLACICFVGMALFIVGLSNLFVGKHGIGFGCLGGAVLVLLVFKNRLTPFLGALDDNHQSQ
jgi:Na+/proline symporter